jgi:hypothetical protein
MKLTQRHEFCKPTRVLFIHDQSRHHCNIVIVKYLIVLLADWLMVVLVSS